MHLARSLGLRLDRTSYLSSWGKFYSQHMATMYITLIKSLCNRGAICAEISATTEVGRISNHMLINSELLLYRKAREHPWIAVSTWTPRGQQDGREAIVLDLHLEGLHFLHPPTLQSCSHFGLKLRMRTIDSVEEVIAWWQNSQVGGKDVENEDSSASLAACTSTLEMGGNTIVIPTRG
jgi:hypothetical protein